jgi:hypothetical protein
MDHWSAQRFSRIDQCVQISCGDWAADSQAPSNPTLEFAAPFATQTSNQLLWKGPRRIPTGLKEKHLERAASRLHSRQIDIDMYNIIDFTIKLGL